jgi:hypothetical protein
VEHPGPILDYASPRPRVNVRLPANSVLDIQVSSGRCVITETLTGQNVAIGALIFSAFVLVVTAASTLDGIAWKPRQEVAFMSALALTIIGLSLLVVRNTWRKTIITIADGEFSMTSTAPFMATRRYAWPAGEIADVQVVTTDEAASLGDLPTFQRNAADLLGELRIFPKNGAELHLFTDHPLVQLRGLAVLILKTLCGDDPPAPAPVTKA